MSCKSSTIRLSLVFTVLAALTSCAPAGSPSARHAAARAGSALMAIPGLPPGFVWCAREGDWCSFEGTRTVAYGAAGAYFFKTATNGIMCNNANFGDPLVGVDKNCYVK